MHGGIDMRICIINPFPKKNTRLMFELAESLMRYFDVTLITPYPDPAKCKVYSPKTVSERRFLKLLPYAVDLRKYLEKQKFDRVFCYKVSPLSYLGAYWYRKKHKTPLILHTDDVDSLNRLEAKDYPHYLIVRALEKTMNTADVIIAGSTTLTKYLIQTEKISPKKIKYIPSGVDCNFFRPHSTAEIKKKIGGELDINKKYVTFVGNLRNPFHIKTYLDCINEIIEKNKDACFLFIGKHNPELEKMFRKNVKFAGFVPQEKLPYYLAASTILAAPFDDVPAMKYPCNLKILEYLAMGKPVVSSDVGDVKKNVGNGGIIIKPGNRKEIISAIDKLLKNEKLCNRLGKNARKIALEKFGWPVVAKQFAEAIKNAGCLR